LYLWYCIAYFFHSLGIEYRGQKIIIIIARVGSRTGGAEASLKRGGKTNDKDRLIVFSLSKISAENYQNRFMYVKFIMSNISVVLGTQCTRVHTAYVVTFYRSVTSARPISLHAVGLIWALIAAAVGRPPYSFLAVQLRRSGSDVHDCSRLML